MAREEGAHAGLTNLGATCYVNSLLQLWFHNGAFRRAVYGWTPASDPTEKDTPSDDAVADEFVPRSPVAHLQLLFALMQFSKRRCPAINP